MSGGATYKLPLELSALAGPGVLLAGGDMSLARKSQHNGIVSDPLRMAAAADLS